MKFLFKKRNVSPVFLLSLVLLSFFSFSLVSAEVDTSDVRDVFKVNDVISYVQPCINNGSYCSSAATCNYTFYDRDNTVTVKNAPASNVGTGGASLWEYNITHTETGLYKTDICCEDASVNDAKGCETLYYQVTGDGFNTSMGFYVLIIVLSFGTIIFGFWLEDPWIVTFGSFGLYFVAIYVLFNGIAGIKDPVTTWGMGIILIGVATYISVRTGMEVIGN